MAALILSNEGLHLDELLHFIHSVCTAIPDHPNLQDSHTVRCTTTAVIWRGTTGTTDEFFLSLTEEHGTFHVFCSTLTWQSQVN